LQFPCFSVEGEAMLKEAD